MTGFYYFYDLNFPPETCFIRLNSITSRAHAIWLRLIIFYSKLVFAYGCSSNLKPVNENYTYAIYSMICLSLMSLETNQPSKAGSVLIQTFYILFGCVNKLFSFRLIWTMGQGIVLFVYCIVVDGVIWSRKHTIFFYGELFYVAINVCLLVWLSSITIWPLIKASVGVVRAQPFHQLRTF